MKKYCLLFIFVCFSCGWNGWAQESAPSVKNVIWVIADGMGPEIMGFFMEGVRYGDLDGFPDKVSHMETMIQKGTQGLYFNKTYDTIVTDSAASATQMATGQYSRPDYIGVNFEGQKVKTLMELAQEKGKSIGVVSDAYVTDATPAGFTAHANSRRLKEQIARQQIELGVDVISGGGLKYFNRDLQKQAKEKGYTLATTRQELLKVKKGKLLGLFSDTGMPMAIEMYRYPNTPSLAEQTRKAIELLEQNKEGFVLMVEAGKVDWAAHANDPGSLLAEMKTLDETLGYVLAYADKHPDTLVYLNADHDTGLGTFVYQYLDRQKVAQKTKQGEVLYNGNTAYHSFKIYKQLEKQKRSLYYLEQELYAQPSSMLTRDYLERRFGEALGEEVDFSTFTDLSNVRGVLKQLNAQRGISWATGNHSAAPLIGVAYGPQAELFSGVYHNTDIFPRMKQALGWSEKE